MGGVKAQLRVLEALQIGPATSRDIAAEVFGSDTWRNVKIASAHLCALRDMGLVRSGRQVRLLRVIYGKETRARPSYMWERVP